MPDLIRRGALRAVYRWDNPLEHPEVIGAPPGTRSQIIRYVDDDGAFVALIHQYLLPDGTLGASGRPDPKRLRVGNEIWVAIEAMKPPEVT